MNWFDLIDKKAVDQINREAARGQKKRDAFNNWLMKQKGPMTRRANKKYSNFRLQEMKEAGIEYVSLIGCNHPPDECDALRAVKGQLIEIDLATYLPLPGCDKKHCKCMWLAKKPPEQPLSQSSITKILTHLY